MGGPSKSPSVSQPVVVSTSEAATKAREQQLAALRRKGQQSTLLAGTQDGNTQVATKTLLGGV